MVTVLIETLWNVKNSSSGLNAISPWVLIETLWNVKDITHLKATLHNLVLIETLWNVKEYVIKLLERVVKY